MQGPNGEGQMTRSRRFHSASQWQVGSLGHGTAFRRGAGYLSRAVTTIRSSSYPGAGAAAYAAWAGKQPAKAKPMGLCWQGTWAGTGNLPFRHVQQQDTAGRRYGQP